MQKKGPWTVLATREVYKNPWIRVREDSVLQPNGEPGIYGVIEQKGGVSVIPIGAAGEVYITQEYHYAIERITIEAVSGGIETGETPLEAAQRELKEEAGFTAQKWTYLGYIDPFTSLLRSPNHMFLAEDLSQGESNPEGTEQITIIKMHFAEALQKVIASEITHGASVAAILKIEKMKNRK